MQEGKLQFLGLIGRFPQNRNNLNIKFTLKI